MRRLSLRRQTGKGIAGIAKDTGWTGLTEAFQLLSSLVTFTLLVRSLGPVYYGQYIAVMAIAGALSTIATVWVGMLLLQQVIQEKRSPSSAFGAALGLAGASVLVAFGVAAVGGQALLPGVNDGVLLGLVAAELVAAAGVSVSGIAWQTLRGFATATRVRLLVPSVRLFVVASLAAVGEIHLMTLAVWQLVCFGTLGLVVPVVTAHRLSLRLRPTRPSLKDLRGGAPHALVLGSFNIQEDADKTLLVHYGHAADAGLYAAGYKLVQLGLTPVRALVSSSHPRFLIDTPGERNEHVRRTLRYTLPSVAYGLVATLAIELLAPIVPPLLGHQYDGTVNILRVVAPLVALRSASMFALNALLGLGRYSTRVLVIVISTLINILLNVAWIPAHSWHGAAFSTIVTEIVFVIGSWTALVRAQRRHDRNLDLRGETLPQQMTPEGNPAADTATTSA